MKHKTKAVLGAALGLGLAASGATAAYAAGTGPNPMSTLAAAIASKFNLNQSEVEQVIKDQMTAGRADMQAQHEERESARLAKAVAEGKLTQAQADLIAEHRAQMKTTMETLKGKTGEELKSAIEALREANKEWASTNNIPEEYLRPGLGDFGPRGPGFMKAHSK